MTNARWPTRPAFGQSSFDVIRDAGCRLQIPYTTFVQKDDAVTGAGKVDISDLFARHAQTLAIIVQRMVNFHLWHIRPLHRHPPVHRM